VRHDLAVNQGHDLAHITALHLFVSLDGVEHLGAQAADQLIGALLRKGGQAGQRQQACSHDAKKALQEKVVHSHRV
jgi:hypothetical protein